MALIGCLIEYYIALMSIVQAPIDTATLFIDLLVVLQVRWQQIHLVLLSLCGDHLLMGRLSGPLELEGTGLFLYWNTGLWVGSFGILGLKLKMVIR